MSVLEKNINSENYDELLRLDNQLCFALYIYSKELVRLYKPLLDKFDLTYTQYITLLALWERDNISVKELGVKLFLDSGTLTPILKKLESRNILNRIPSPVDKRQILISLTDDGIKLKELVHHIPHKIFCKSGLDFEEAIYLKNKLHNAITMINANL